MTTSSTNGDTKVTIKHKKTLRTSRQRHVRAPPLSKPPQTLEQPTFPLTPSIRHQNMSKFLFSMYLRRGNQRRRSGGASGESVGLHSWGSERWKECEGLMRARWRVLWCAGSRNSYTSRAGGMVEYWRRECYIRESFGDILCIMKGRGIGGGSFGFHDCVE